MITPAKTQIAAKLLEMLEPLKIDHGFAVIERKVNAFLLEPRRPAIHVITGHEIKVGEDMQGIAMELPVHIRCFFRAGSDYAAALDEREAQIKEMIETDTQIGGMALRFAFEGCLPFNDEINLPDGGFRLDYVALYRRRRGNARDVY